MTFLQGIQKAAINAIDNGCWESALQILDLGLSFAYAGIPKEAMSLWESRCKLNLAFCYLDDLDKSYLWDKYTKEAVEALEKEIIE